MLEDIKILDRYFHGNGLYSFVLPYVHISVQKYTARIILRQKEIMEYYCVWRLSHIKVIACLETRWMERKIC